MGGALSTTKACFTGGGGLADAVLDGDDQVVKSVLTNNPKLAGATLSLRDGSTAVHLAATEGRLDYLKLLVETFEASRTDKGRKCKPKHISRMLNRRNMHGQTALMLACKFGHAEAVTWLLEQGANPMLFDSIHSRVCLHYAALYGQSDCIHALFADDAYVSMSAGPALLRNAHVLDSQGFHKFIDVRAAMGFAAIHMAASQGHWQAVVALLKHGASLTVRCYGVLRADFAVPARWKPNSTPLHIAAARGSTTMVKHMLQAYAEQVAREPATPDVRLMRDFGDMRPVDIARAYGYLRIATLLDPGRPVELLAYITAGGHMRLGPPSLSALAARALRGRLLHQLAAIEPRLASTRASRASSIAGFGSKVSATAGPAEGAAIAAAGGQQEAGQRQHGGRNRFVDDFGCAPGCSHAHCGRRVPESQAHPGAATTAGQGHAAAATGQAPAPAEVAAEPPDRPAPSPPGFVRIVGLSSPAGSSPGRGILRNGSNRDRSGFRSTSGRSPISGDDGSQRSGDGSVHGAAAAAEPAQPRQRSWQPASLLPAPSAAAAGAIPAADPFAASGTIADLPVSAALQPQPQTVSFEAAAAPTASGSQSSAGFSQHNMSAFASASFSPFQDERDSEGEVTSPLQGLQGLRQNSIISMSIRPLPSGDLTSDSAAAANATAAAAAATANGSSLSSNAGSSCTPAGRVASNANGVVASPGSATGLPPIALQGRRASVERRWSVDRRRSRSIALPRAASRRPPSARSLAAGLEHGESTPMGTPPQARRVSFFRDAVSALATRTASGMIRRNNSEMVLDARLGDVYTGGDGGPSPPEHAAAPPAASAAAAPGAPAAAAAAATTQRASFDSRTAVQAELQQQEAGEGEDVVVAELTSNDRRTSIQFLVRRASTGLARAPSAASVAGDECDICFDARLEVAIRGCGHQFCAPCLRGVCEATPDKTPRCPFCRRVMDGVVPAAAKPGIFASGTAAPVANKAPPAMGLDDICNAVIAAQA